MDLFEEYKAELSYLDINNPKFEKATMAHDWRNHVPKNFQKNWHLFTERERKIIAILAEKQANEEEWD